MPNYRRYFVQGGTYFFTVKTEGNQPIFGDPAAAALLGQVIRETKSRWPFESIAMALLPDHLHVVWSLPSGDAEYSARWGWLKKEFTKRYLQAGGSERPMSISRRRNRRRGVWQRRFWEHTIQDEEDLEACIDYVHYNPVKHGYSRSPADWPYSTFHRWVGRGAYPEDWGRTAIPISDDRSGRYGE